MYDIFHTYIHRYILVKKDRKRKPTTCIANATKQHWEIANYTRYINNAQTKKTTKQYKIHL